MAAMTPPIDTSGAVAVLDDVTSASLVVASVEATPLDQRLDAVYLLR